MAMMPKTLQEGQRMLTDALDVLKKDVGFFRTRSFVEIVHFAVSCILESGGSMKSRCINQSNPMFATAAAKSGMVLRIMSILGFVEHEWLPGAMMLVNYETSEPTLKAFSDMAENMLLLNLEGIPSVYSIDNVVSLFAYLAYTLRIRLCLQCAYTPSAMRPLIARDIETAVSDFEVAIGRLELLPAESDSREIWTNLKAEFIAYPKSPIPDEVFGHISVVIEDLAQRIAFEMMEAFPQLLITLIAFLQNISAIVGITKRGDQLNSEGALIYLHTTESLLPDSFSAEFMEHNRSLRQLMDSSLGRQFTDEENLLVHQRAVWQARHFLSHFRAAEIDMTACSARLVTMARRQGLRLSPSLAAEDVAAALPSISEFVNGVEESDREEKADKDKSEKEKQDVVSDRESLRHLLETADDCLDLATLCEEFERDAVLEELEELAKKKEMELESLKDDLEQFDEVLALDEPAVVKTALTKAREKTMQDLEKVSLKMGGLRQILYRLNINEERRSLDASLSNEQLHSILRNISLFQRDVQELEGLIVSALPVMPDKAANLLSNVLGMDRDKHFKDKLQES